MNRRSHAWRPRFYAAIAVLLAFSAPPALARNEAPSVIAAAQSGDLPELRRLVASGSEVNARDAAGNTALFYAAAGGQTEMVAALLRMGADPSIVGANGWTPSQVANFAGHGHAVEIIGAASQSRTEQTMAGAAFSLSPPGGSRLTTTSAARAPADPFGGEFGQARSTDVPEDLRRAAKAGDFGALRALIAQGVTADAPDGAGRTALSYAAFNGHDAAIAVLLDSGADIDHRDAKGMTPLMAAVAGGSARVVQRLLDAGADRRLKSRDGRTAADIARDLNDAGMSGLLSGAAPIGLFATAASNSTARPVSATRALGAEDRTAAGQLRATVRSRLLQIAQSAPATLAAPATEAPEPGRFTSEDVAISGTVASPLPVQKPVQPTIQGGTAGGLVAASGARARASPGQAQVPTPPAAGAPLSGTVVELAASAATLSTLLGSAPASPPPASARARASPGQAQVPTPPAAGAPLPGTVVELAASAATLPALLGSAPPSAPSAPRVTQAPGPTTLAASRPAVPAAVVTLAQRREPEQPFQPIFGNGALGVQAAGTAEDAPAKPAVPPPAPPPPQPTPKLKPLLAPLSAGARAPVIAPVAAQSLPAAPASPALAPTGESAETATRAHAAQWDDGFVPTKPDSLPPKRAPSPPLAVAARLRPAESPVIPLPLPPSDVDLRTALAPVSIAKSPPAPAPPLTGPKVDDPADAGSSAARSVNAEPVANPAVAADSGPIPAPAVAASASASASDLALAALSPLDPLDLPQVAIAPTSAADRVADVVLSRASPAPTAAPLPGAAPSAEPALAEPKILTPPPRALSQLRDATLPAQSQESPRKTAPARLPQVGQPSTRADLAQEGFQFVSDPTVEELSGGSSETQWTAANPVSDGASAVRPLTTTTGVDRSALAQAGLAPDPSAAFAGASARPESEPLGNRLTTRRSPTPEPSPPPPAFASRQRDPDVQPSAAPLPPRRPQIALREPSPAAETLIRKESTVSDMSFLEGRWSFDCADSWYEFKQIGEARFERFYSKSQSRRIVNVTRQGQLMEAVSRNNNVIVYLKYHVIDRNRMVLLDTTYSEGGDNFFSVQGNLEFARCG